MRFVHRLLVMVAVVLIAFASVSVLGVRALEETRQIAALSADLERLSSETWRLQSLTFEIRIADDLRSIVPQWRSSADELESRLTAINDDPAVLTLVERDEVFADGLLRLRDLVDLVQKELESFEATLSEFTDDFTSYPTGSLQQFRDGGPNFGVIQIDRVGQRVTTYLDDTLQSAIDRIIAQLEAVREASVTRLVLVFFGVVGTATLVVALLILLFMRSLRRGFARIDGALVRLSSGDLTVRLDRSSRDEIGELSARIQRHIDEFSRVIGTIQDISRAASLLRTDLVAGSEESSASVTQIGGNISSIGSTIGELDGVIEHTGARLDEINSSIRELETQIERQTQSVEDSSSAVEQMAASVNGVSRIAADRQEAARTLRAVTSNGHENVEATDEKVSAISSSVEEILGIITVINTIASQTSILSMNAAIEAAHAGEYGKGFSVVAAEIRRLSESTNENAKRIKQQLEQVAELTGETKRMSGTTRESFQAVETEVGTTSDALSEISATMRELSEGTESVLTTTAGAGEITQAIRRDATTVLSRSEEITREMRSVREMSSSVRGGIEEIGVGTREINHMVENLSSVTRAMTDKIDQLGASVDHFRIADE
ncbi:MAG TPA: methyl-accepting chemotaxis protein [Spirochaetia bacterium]|nr:methyl-accepting chemotaxis protein [Spirochaetia bacterium]